MTKPSTLLASLTLCMLLAPVGAIIGTNNPAANAQKFEFHEGFSGNNPLEDTWQFTDRPGDLVYDLQPGALTLSTDDWVLMEITSTELGEVENRSEWSVRGLLTMHEGSQFAAVGTAVYNHSALEVTGLRAGTGPDNMIRGLPYAHVEEQLLIQMDAFDGRITGSVWKEGAPDTLVQVHRSYLPVDTRPAIGVTGSATIQDIWISTKPIPLFESAVVEVGFKGNYGKLAATIDDVVVEKSPSLGTQNGLLQRWYSIDNPGTYEAVLSQVFDPLFPEESPKPDVPPFHSGSTWWAGNVEIGDGLARYPAELSGAVRVYENAGAQWSLGNNEKYTVYLSGEIFIPESGTYRFLDGVDDYAAFGIDVNDDGFVELVDGEFIINDNLWTSIDRAANDGGFDADEIPSHTFNDIKPGGEWFTVEAIVAEGNSSDSGVFYWDYDAGDRDGDGIQLGDAPGFPDKVSGENGVIATEDIPHLLIPQSYLRSTGGEQIDSGTITASLDNSLPYHIEIGAGGQHDRLLVERLSEKLSTALDLNDAEIQLTLIGDVAPGSYSVFDVDEFQGIASVLPSEFNDLIDTSRLFLDGTITVLGTDLDCNDDGLTNVDDSNCTSSDVLDVLLGDLNILHGDLDGNGEVDFSDFLAFSSNFGGQGAYTDGDLDLDGEVAFGDFLILASNFGRTSAVAAVPEPNGSRLLWLISLGFIDLRRRSAATAAGGTRCYD